MTQSNGAHGSPVIRRLLMRSRVLSNQIKNCRACRSYFIIDQPPNFQRSITNGDEGDRTPNLCLAKAALSRLSYIPYFRSPSRHEQNCQAVQIHERVERMGLGGLEPPTSSLSGMRSNQLSYKPLESRTTDVLNGPVNGNRI